MRAARRLFIAFALPASLITLGSLAALGGTIALLAGRGETRPGAQLLMLGLAALAGVGAQLMAAVLLARRHAAPYRALLAATEAVSAGEPVVPAITRPREAEAAERNLARIAETRARLERSRRAWLIAVAEEMRLPVEELVQQVEATPGGDAGAAVPPITRLARIAEDLRAVALADLGRLPVRLAPQDARALIHNAAYVARPLAEAAGVALATELGSETAPVRWDAAQIEQLLGALIEHSLRYTPAGGRIALGVTPRGGAWQLTIDDSAPGVDIEVARQLFEPFYRAADLPEESLAQLSLAFATAQAIVEAHHGRIEASESPLGGLRVAVVLPAEPPVA